ncbi:H(+)/Cl(-) exchange transporter 6-like isoform X2 [Dysidea avara]
MIEPVAAGSGIPEIKCFLNGIKVPHVTRLFTLLAKAIGVLFSVAGGFFVGKEGPMIHSGAIIGAGLPQFRSMALKWIDLRLPFFRSDRDIRDFVSSGAAAGVAAAFGAPIGGVLFSLEEGSSFWNQALTWRTLFCSMCATFTLNIFLSGVVQNNWKALDQPGLVNFGVFRCAEGKNCYLWTGPHLLVFVVMGIIGGLLGALFNEFNTVISKYRMKHVAQKRASRILRLVEVLLVATVTTSVVFALATTLGSCVDKSKSNHTAEFQKEIKTYFCPEGKYNDMATLLFNSQEVAIKQLFHQDGAFTLSTLGNFFVCYFLIACWTYGVAVPSGLFVPCLVVGAAYGRFTANILQNIGFANIYPGTFALIGAASFLGGVVRMTISLTVILIESTNEISYGLPIMITLMVAKWTGDLFNKGLYDIHIELRKIPLLEWEWPEITENLIAKDIMDTRLSCIGLKPKVRDVEHMIRSTTHNAFMVVAPLGSSASESTVVISNVPQAHVQEMSTLDRTMHFNEITSVATPAMVDPFEESFGGRSQIQTRIMTYITSVKQQQGGARLNNSSSGTSTMLYSDDIVCPQLRFLGIILRSQLLTLLKCKAYDKPNVLSYDDLMKDFPHFCTIDDLNISDYDKSKTLDMIHYINPCPYTVIPLTPVSRVFNLFRTMGLRHLVVVDGCGLLCGVITRLNLTHDFLHKCHHRRQQMEL